MSISFKQKIIRDFSRSAKVYDNYAILQRKVADKLFEMANITSGPILDIGCGTGYFHELLRKNKIYLPLIQLDISTSMCKVAANYGSPPEYGETYTCTSDMHNLPFSDNIFSSIFSSMTMQWSDPLEEVLSETKRVLTPDGTFAISLVSNGSMQQLHESFSLANFSPAVHIFPTIAEIENNIKIVGFSDYKIHTDNITIHYSDILSLFSAIKNVGASYKSNTTKTFKSKRYFSDIEKIYRDKFLSPDGLPLSWNILYITGRK